MSDRDLRVLERRAAEGDEADAVALLAAQLRTGRVSRERAVIAARLGDPVARACCAFGSPLDWMKHKDRVEALSALARTTVVRLACDWAEVVLPIFERVHPSDARPRLAIEAARAWVARPSEATARAARAAWAAGDAWDARAAAWAAWAAGDAGDAWAARAARAAARAAGDAGDAWAAAWAAWAAGDAWDARAAGDRQRLDVIRALLTPEDPS